VCGDRLHLSGVTVDDIVAGNDVEIQGRQMSESTIGSCTRIGDGTKIDFPWSSSIIGSAVAIGSRCKLSAGAIDDGVKMGDDVTLQYCRRILRLSRIESGVTMGAVYIGTKTVIGRGSAIGAILSDDVLIGNHVRVGENTIVRPGVMIPHNWEIPSNTIVNPHPDRPIIIPRTS